MEKTHKFYYPIQNIVLVILFSMFLSGYFPDSDTGVHHDSVRNTQLPDCWNRSVGHLVIMVIDALRLDFVSDEAGWNGSKFKIKYLQDLIERKEAVVFPTRTSSPTVTLPRIKVEF